jgi:glycosyltransferase involved in cell wall biosynthesis
MDGVELIIAGHGKDADIIIEKIRKNSHSKYIGKIPYNEILENSLRADVLFAFYDTIIPNNKYASPNKLFEAMMCGKPIIVNENTCMAETVQKEKCGILIPFGKIEQIKMAILTLKNNHELSILMGLNGRNAYEERYSWKIMENRLLDVYSELEINRL